jgi:ATP-dependent RNA helicase RhlE
MECTTVPFLSLGLSPIVCKPLTALGYTQPTPVQQQAIPIVLSGRDLLARAQTGTGKTAAFGLPMIDRLRVVGGVPAGPRLPRALVLVPTRELALQVKQSLATYSVPANLRVAVIFGGVSFHAQRQELRRGTDIIVATPGRLIDHLDQGTVHLASIRVLVLDEADRMLDMGFLPPLRRILTELPAERQTLLFSATLPSEVTRLAKEFTQDPARVDVSEGQVMAQTVTHQGIPTVPEQKGALLTHLLTTPLVPQALVFCRTKHGANRVGQYLERAGVTTAVIHGNKSQAARVKALEEFKRGRVAVLVATDIAARGLDIAQLPLVVNFDLPLVAEDYIHRAGRTGRAGHPGRAVSLVTAEEAPLMRAIQRLLPDPIEKIALDGVNSTATSEEALPEPDRRHQGLPGHPRGPRPQRRPAPSARAEGGPSSFHGDDRPRPPAGSRPPGGGDSHPGARAHGSGKAPRPMSGQGSRPSSGFAPRPHGGGGYSSGPRTSQGYDSRPGAGSGPRGGAGFGSRPGAPYGSRPQAPGTGYGARPSSGQGTRPGGGQGRPFGSGSDRRFNTAPGGRPQGGGQRPWTRDSGRPGAGGAPTRTGGHRPAGGPRRERQTRS